VRAVWITHGYPRYDGDIAGAFLERLAEALVVRGHRIAVVTPSDAGSAGTSRRAGVEVHRVRYAPASWETLAHRGTLAEAIRSPRGVAAFGGLVLAQARVASMLARHEDADLLHAHWWVPGGMSARVARALCGRPYVVTLHGTDVAILSRSAAARMLARRVLRGAAAVTAVSSYLAERAAAVAGLDPAVIGVVPMPVSAPACAPSPGGGGVVTVGRLTRQKRVDLILEAVAHLEARGRVLELTIVGDGPERPRLEQRARELKLDARTRFLGRLAPAAVAAAIQHADVFAFAAEREGFGLAVAEAFMLGIPVAAVRSGGVPEIVPAEGAGRLVPEGDSEALATAIGDLTAAPGSRRSALELGAVWRERLASGSVAAIFEAVYRQVVANDA
jgi:glycosyltransferase involved in cell wall biosynthesis